MTTSHYYNYSEYHAVDDYNYNDYDYNHLENDHDSNDTTDWIKGIGFSLLASLIGGASKLALRKSWKLLQQQEEEEQLLQQQEEQEQNNVVTTPLLQLSEEESSPEFPNNNNNNHHDDTPQVQHYYYYTAYALRGGGIVGMTLLNPLCSVVAMQYASPSILAPFSGLTLIWILLGSPAAVQETPTARQIRACASLLLGQGLVAVFGDHENNHHNDNDDTKDPDALLQSYREPAYVGYLIGLTVWMMLLTYVLRWPDRHHPLTRKCAWGVAGGSITGLQNFLKDALTLGQWLSSSTSSVYYYYAIWIGMVLGAIASAGTGLVLLLYCMKRHAVTYAAAMFVGSFVVSASIMSAVHYHTVAHLYTPAQQCLYPTGLGLVLLAVGLLATEPAAVPATTTMDESTTTSALSSPPPQRTHSNHYLDPPQQHDDEGMEGNDHIVPRDPLEEAGGDTLASEL